MWNVYLISLVVFVVALQNVNAQDYSDFYKRLASLRRPVIINYRTGQRTYYESPKNLPISEESQERSTGDASKVRIDVYYETDCPDSMRFITTQLYPLMQEMGEILDVYVYPYGKAYKYYDEEKNKYGFSCHHGPSECFGNRVQSCALKFYPNLMEALSFINCMETYPRPSQSGRKCARRHSLDWNKIEKCANGELGERLMHEMANATESLNPNLYYVPWIVFDGVFDQGDFRKAQRNLKLVVCNRYKGYHPRCANV